MITYMHLTGTPFRIQVKLDGKYVGDIKQDADGYFYRTRKSRGRHEGERFETVDAVKASLENNDA